MRTSRVANRIAGMPRRGRLWFTAAAGLALAASALGGCGDRNLVLNVDVLSYSAAARAGVSFGPLPALPGGVVSGEQNVAPPMDVNLFENLGGVATVQSVSLRIDTVCQDQTGAGVDTLRMYMSDTATDPRTTPPVMVQVLNLQPGVTDTTRADITGDARVIDLFSKKSMRIVVTTSFRGPDSGAPLEGHIALAKLDAVVVTARKGT